MTYKLRFDRSRFLTFEVSPDELEEKFGADYLFMLDEPGWSDFWKPINVKFIDFSDKKNVTTVPEITCWFIDQLVLNEKAYTLLHDHLASYGEFLPVKCEGIPYWVLHVTNMKGIDIVDEDKSNRHIEEGGYIEVKSLFFKPELVEDVLLFKTGYDGFKNIYCSENFRKLVDDNQLQGLVFDEDLAGIF